MTNVQCRMFNVRMFRHLGGTASPSVDAAPRHDATVGSPPPPRSVFRFCERTAAP